MKLKGWIIVIVVMLLCAVGSGVLAQDVDPIPVIDVPGAGELIVAAIVTIIGVFINSPVTTFIVSLLKRLPFLDAISAPTMTLLVAGLLWVITAVAQYLGFGSQWESLLQTLAQILPPLAGFVLTLLGSSAIYQTARAQGAAFIGYQRTA